MTHPNKDIRKAVEHAIANGWTVTTSNGHAWGIMRCAPGCCQKSIWSTPKSPHNHAKDIRRAVDKCPGQ